MCNIIMNTLKEKVLGFFKKYFHEYFVKELPLDDDDESIGVGIFDVEDNKVSEIKEKCNSLIEEQFPEDSFLIYPRIKSKSVTREFYPECIVTYVSVETTLSSVEGDEVFALAA